VEFKNEDALVYLQGLERNSVDLILTDPPYAISRDTNFASGVESGRDVDRFRVNYQFGEWDTVDADYFLETFSEAYKVMRIGATLVCFYDIWKIESLKAILENCGFRMFRFIEWVKTNPVPINSKINYLSNSREVAIVCVKGSKPTFNSVYNNGIFKYPIYQGRDRFHTTQKSLPLFEELCRIHSNEGDTVLDMFAGSATTLLAAKNTGRIYRGCEKDGNYYNKAKERLNES
jgi:site-specific DNA-methyltransferase (adenine-specific)